MSAPESSESIPLVTSVPPSLRRTTPEGADIGKAYLAACIASWSASGFTPVSVNARRELAQSGGGLGLRVIGVERDAASLTGKPLVYFHDLLSVALALPGDGPVAITNSDILFDPAVPLLQHVARLRPDQVLVARRTDILSMQERVGAPYRDGFDFFAGHRSALRRVEDIGLVFGAPWWDHFVPAALLLAGLSPVLLRAPSVFHLVHSERWDPSQWTLFGDRFVRHLRAARDRRATTSDALSTAYQRRLRPILKTDEGLLASCMRRLPRGEERAQGRRRLLLSRLSNATIAFLDEHC